MFRKIAVVVILFALSAFATHVAILETTAGEGVVTLEEKQYLTDVLRSEAVKILPAEQNYTIMTRENISAMLPPGKSLEDCEGTCVVETGKNIAADYVAQGHLGRFANSLTITVELYETAGNKLVGSFGTKAPDVTTLEKAIREKSKDLFSMVLANSVGKVNLQPVFSDSRGPESELVIKIDGKSDKDGLKYTRGLWELTAGVHSLEFYHRCYEPQSFRIVVKSDNIVDVNNVLDVSKKYLSIRSVYNGAARKAPVYVNGIIVGNTPWQGKVPVCASIEVGKSDYRQSIFPEWGDKDSLNYVHQLMKIQSANESISTELARDAAKEASSGNSKPANYSLAKPIAIALMSLGAVSLLAGAYENMVLGKERNKYDEALYDRQKDYDDQWEKVESTGTLRNILWGTGGLLLTSGIVVYVVF